MILENVLCTPEKNKYFAIIQWILLKESHLLQCLPAFAWLQVPALRLTSYLSLGNPLKQVSLAQFPHL